MKKLCKKLFLVFVLLFSLSYLNGNEGQESLPEHIFKASKKYKIIGIGEGNDHNIQNNFQILQNTLKLYTETYKVTYLFLEYSESDQVYIDECLKTGNENILYRYSIAVPFLIKKIYELNKLNKGKIIPLAAEKNIDFSSFRKKMEGVANRDKSVYEKLYSVMESLSEDERVVIYYGDFHIIKKRDENLKNGIKNHMRNIPDLVSQFKTLGEYIAADSRHSKEYYTFDLTDTFFFTMYNKGNKESEKLYLEKLFKLYNNPEDMTNPRYYANYTIINENNIDEMLVYDELPLKCFPNEYYMSNDRFLFILEYLKMFNDTNSNYDELKYLKRLFQMFLSRASGEFKLFDDGKAGYSFYKNWFEANKGKLKNFTEINTPSNEFIWRIKNYLYYMNANKNVLANKYNDLNRYFLGFIFKEMKIDDKDFNALAVELNQELSSVIQIPAFESMILESYQVSLIRYLDDNKYDTSELKRKYKSIYGKSGRFAKEINN